MAIWAVKQKAHRCNRALKTRAVFLWSSWHTLPLCLNQSRWHILYMPSFKEKIFTVNDLQNNLDNYHVIFNDLFCNEILS